MKVMLLNPPGLHGEVYLKEIWRCGGRSSSKGRVRDGYPQIGLAYIAAVLEKDEHEVRIVDGVITRLTLDDLLKEVGEFNPDVLIIHTSTPSYVNDYSVCRSIQKKFPNVKIGLVGTHSSSLPEESLKDFNADFVVIGEAEYTVRDIVGNLNSDWSEIDGLCFGDDKGNTIKTKSRKPIGNLDELPFPARHLLPNHLYTPPLNSKPYTTVIPSRGCPYQCIYCRSGTVWENKVRLRSPENIVEEIKQIVNQFGIKHIHFMTDTFTINKKWVLRLCDLLIKEKLGVRWACNSRVDTIDSEMLKSMKDAGCYLIAYGIESGNQKILDKSKKGIRLDQVESVVSDTKDVGIKVAGYFMVGLPGETWDTIDETIRFAIKLGLDYVYFNIAIPYPGTGFYDMAVENRWLTTSDWNQYNVEDCAVTKIGELDPDDLLSAQKKAYRAFYLRPTYILRKLFSVKSIDELKYFVNAGLSMLRISFT